MFALRALATLMAVSAAVASPLFPRQPKEVDVYDIVTVVQHVTVTAPIQPIDTVQVHENDIVAVAPVIVTVQVTATAPVPAPTGPVAVQNTQEASPEPSTIVQAHQNAVVSGSPVVVTAVVTVTAAPNPVPTSTAPVHPQAVDSTSEQAAATSVAPPAAATNAPASTTDFLPTSTIIFDLQPDDATYTGLVLYSHNVHRQNHTDTPNLTYNSTLVGFAKEKAEGCQWNEDLPDDAVAAGVGMNQAEGTNIGAANITFIVNDMWYNSEYSIFPGFNIANPDTSDFDLWGHFTQVVWKDTRSVGCWSAACDRHDGASHQIGSGFYTVCTYWPPANFPGEYAKEVGAPLGHAIVTGV